MDRHSLQGAILLLREGAILNISTHLIALALVPLSGCGVMKWADPPPASIQQIVANQRESISAMKELLAEQVRHNKAIETAILPNKEVKKDPKVDDKKPPGKKG